DRRPERDDGADEVPVPHPERSGRPGAARDQGQRPRLSRRTGHLGGGLLHRGLDRAARARGRAVVQRAGASALIYPGGGVVPPSPRQRPQSPPYARCRPRRRTFAITPRTTWICCFHPERSCPTGLIPSTTERLASSTACRITNTTASRRAHWCPRARSTASRARLRITCTT